MQRKNSTLKLAGYLRISGWNSVSRDIKKADVSGWSWYRKKKQRKDFKS